MASLTKAFPAAGGERKTRGRGFDILLAIVVTAIVLLLVVHVPPGAMDFFIATNLAVSFLILLASLYISDTADFTSFPTLILLTTIFRLAINIGSARLILLDGDAGKIIYSFGNLLVGGNFTVGAVIYVLLFIVQFVVIAKGSERASEAAARFTLDAMPQKQAAIDMDLNKNLIDFEEARRRRSKIARESKLYGAMEGATKFVKGDAIAGLIISIVNIIGGLLIGVLQQNMKAGEAAQLYSVLSIGDGLVSQIPSLLITVAAGMVITRVSRNDPDITGRETSVPRELFGQMFVNPTALVIAGILILMLGVAFAYMGGEFIYAFGVCGAALLLFALFKRPAPAEDVSAPAAVEKAASKTAPETEANKALEETYIPPPIIVEIQTSLATLLGITDKRSEDAVSLLKLQQELSKDLGFDIPGITILPVMNEEFPANHYEIIISNRLVGREAIDPFRAYVIPNEKAKNQTAALNGTPFKLSWLRAPLIAVDPGRMRGADANIKFLTPINLIRMHLKHAIKANAHTLIGVTETDELLTKLKSSNRRLVESVTPGILKVAQITEILAQLLKERFPIRDLRAILEAIARYEQKDRPPTIADYVTVCREALIPGVFTDYSYLSKAESGRVLDYYQLDADVEKIIIAKFSGSPVSVDDWNAAEEAFARSVVYTGRDALVFVIVSTQLARRALQHFIGRDYPEIMIITSGELLFAPSGFTDDHWRFKTTISKAASA